MADSTTIQTVLALLQSASPIDKTQGLELLTSSQLVKWGTQLGAHAGASLTALADLTRAPDLPHVERVLACQSMGLLLMTHDNLKNESGHEGLPAVGQLLTGVQAL